MGEDRAVMPEFAWPWVFVLSPLPLLVRWWWPRAGGAHGEALTVPFFTAIAALVGPRARVAQPAAGSVLLLLVVWLLLVIAAARPQRLGDVADIPVTGRDLLLAVDISGSMELPDLARDGSSVTRLQVVQDVAGDFIARRSGDRVGLVLFGRRAYVQTPLTFDRATTRTMLNEAEIGLAGRETAIGDAIGLAVKHLRELPTHRDSASAAERMDARERPRDSRVVVLLTDGANTAGELAPARAAALAAQFNVRIHTIGVGADTLDVGAVMGTPGINTLLRPRMINPSADLDEKLLQHIATTTGGRYFRARDREALERIYHELDQLEPRAHTDEIIRPVTELYYWPLAAAFLGGLVMATVRVMAQKRVRSVTNDD
jgi:Ca-activated chloride channel family protein